MLPLTSHRVANASGQPDYDATDGTPPGPILVVQHDPALRRATTECLASAGFDYREVSTGEEALAWLSRCSPRLILTEYHLPDLLAPELIERLGRRGAVPPFVVVADHGSESVAVDMMKLGARDYLTVTPAFPVLLPRVLRSTFASLDHEGRLRQAEDDLRRNEEQLRRALAELDQRVKQRTEQLARANARLRAEMERRRQAEAELRRHESELAHVARVSMMGEMLAELAHEISQPLGAISSYAQASRRLLSGDLEEARESLIESVSQVTGQAERAAGIIRHLRRLLRKSSPASEWTDVNRLIRSAAEIVDSEASTAGVQMCLELSEPAPTVKVDRIQIEQVLINLLRNAVDALRDQPGPRRRITLRAEQLAHAMVQISVDDNGPGLTDEELEKIFDRFFSTKESGMGMGLPISRSIVENHGGQLWAERRPDGGTALYFTLPQMRQEESTGE